MNRMILAAAFAATALCAPATAQRTVPHHDLRLDREADVRKLDRRIGHAVREACGWAPDYDVLGTNAVRRCRRDTLASVAAQRERLVAAAQATAVAAR